MMLVDSHCHLDFPELYKDVESVVERAEKKDVKYFQSIGTKLSTFPALVGLAERFPSVFVSVGVHPHHAEEEGEALTLDRLLEYSLHPKVISFGETGLDSHYQFSPAGHQEKAFRIHLEAARDRHMPVVIHARDAERETVAILEDEMKKGRIRGVLHCFTGSEYLAKAALSLGLYISVSGIITFPKAQDLRNVIGKNVPIDRLLVETDSPYLAPHPFRGKTNEPSHVPLVAETLAKLKGISVEETARITTDNFFDLFNKAERQPEWV